MEDELPASNERVLRSMGEGMELEGLPTYRSPLPTYNAATDPYLPTSATVEDTLEKAHSSTPLMSTWSRIGVLALVAAVLFQRRDTRHGGGGEVEGVPFSPEIKINGIRQSFMGGGTVSADLLGVVYLAPNSVSRAAFSSFVGSPAAELKDAGFFRTLAEAEVGKTLRLHWTAPTSGDLIVKMLGDAAGTASEPLASALRPLLDTEVRAGADLFLTCLGGTLSLAFAGKPARRVRDTAPVGGTLHVAALCPTLFASLLSPGLLEQGVGNGYIERADVWQ